MKKHTAMVLHPTNIEVEVKVFSDVYCPPDRVYFIGCDSLGNVAPTEEAEKIKEFIGNALQDIADRRMWEGKYNNLLKGLEYWKKKANE